MSSLALSRNERFAVRALLACPGGTIGCATTTLPSVARARNFDWQVTGGSLGDVRVWEMRSRELVSDLKEHIGSVTGIVRRWR
jgi:hypothetical protein